MSEPNGSVQQALLGDKDNQVPKKEKSYMKYLMASVIIYIIIVIATCVSLGLSGRAYETANSNTGAALYDRIGTNVCPNVPGTSLVYEGFTAGFTTAEGSTLFKCLPIDRKYVNFYDDDDSLFKNSSEIRYINATEYRTFVREDITNDHDAYCAVCQVNGRGTIQVLPATNTCLPSWTKEYEGYLMTDNEATTFVCVDESLKPIPATSRPGPNAPVLRHIVNTDYDKARVLSCVVCSK